MRSLSKPSAPTNWQQQEDQWHRSEPLHRSRSLRAPRDVTCYPFPLPSPEITNHPPHTMSADQRLPFEIHNSPEDKGMHQGSQSGIFNDKRLIEQSPLRSSYESKEPLSNVPHTIQRRIDQQTWRVAAPMPTRVSNLPTSPENDFTKQTGWRNGPIFLDVMKPLATSTPDKQRNLTAQRIRTSNSQNSNGLGGYVTASSSVICPTVVSMGTDQIMQDTKAKYKGLLHQRHCQTVHKGVRPHSAPAVLDERDSPHEQQPFPSEKDLSSILARDAALGRFPREGNLTIKSSLKLPAKHKVKD